MKDIKTEKNLKILPKHLGIILDGNGRWAKKRLLPRIAGHSEGMKRVIEIVEYARTLNIPNLTLYAFSTENWKRPKDEVGFLMNLLLEYIKSQLKKLLENDIKLIFIGDIEILPDKIKKEAYLAMNQTEKNKGMNLNIAVNYGGRQEIINGVKKLVKAIENEKYDIDNLDEISFYEFLYTKNSKDCDFVIRTGGEKRISNFLLYEIAYSEFYFTDKLWPDFREADLYAALEDFQKRNRRFGGL